MTPSRISLDYSALGETFSAPGPIGKSKIDNISGLAWTGKHLWTVSNEGASIERLTPVNGGFGDAASFSLRDFFTPDLAPEIDAESLAFDRYRLWICGSHAVKDIEGEQRTFVGCLNLDADGAPIKGSGLALPFGKQPGSLLQAIIDHEGFLADSVEMGKGVDIEGFTISGGEAVFGVRNPLNAGLATLVKTTLSPLSQALTLPDRRAPLRMISASLGQRGVRDLLAVGEDVYILAGPSAKKDAPFGVYLWQGAFDSSHDKDDEIASDQLKFIMEIHALEKERAEGLALLPGGKLLVVHDGADASRRPRPHVIEADIYTLNS